MQVNLPPKVRLTLYVLTAVGSPFVAYLLAVGTIGQLEVNLWAAEVAVINVLASLNVDTTK